MANRHSTFTSQSGSMVGVRPPDQASSQVSTTTLLNAVHTVYTAGRCFELDSSTSVVVNNWQTGMDGVYDGRVHGELAVRAWEHARRRAEDGCVVLASLHQSTPSLLTPFLRTVPLATPNIAYSALTIIQAFTSTVTPANPNLPRHSSLSAKYTFSLTGNLTGLSFALSTSGIDVYGGLLNISPGAGNRAFDVFYYLLTSASSPAEREFLSLSDPSAYALLNKSETYTPPNYLPTADDDAAAEDFRAALKAIGVKGAALRGLLSILAGLLKLGNSLGLLEDEEVLDEVCEDAGDLLGVEPEVLKGSCTTDEREVLIAGIYEALVDWIILKSNIAISAEIRGTDSLSDRSLPIDDDGDTVNITIVEIPSEAIGKAVALRGVFDDSTGINAEMKEDGVPVVPPGHSVLQEMNNALNAVAADVGVTTGAVAREREHQRDQRENVLLKVGVEAEEGGFFRDLLFPTEGQGIELGRKGRFDLTDLLGRSRVWYHLCLHPTDELPSTLVSQPSATSAWSAGAVSRQIRSWRLAEWATRRSKQMDFTVDFDVDEFCSRYASLGCQPGKEGIEAWLLEKGWSNGEVIVGTERIWMREAAWWEAESMIDVQPLQQPIVNPFGTPMDPYPGQDRVPSGYFPPMADNVSVFASREDLLTQPNPGMNRMSTTKSVAPTMAQTIRNKGGDYGLGAKGDYRRDDITFYDPDTGRYLGELDAELGDPSRIEKKTTSKTRQIWVAFVWATTWWIPSFLLRFIGRMKRPDVRMAWREKLVLCFGILFLNAFIIFYIIWFGKLLCPNYDKAWNEKELSYHSGSDDFYVAVRGKVYDISKFWKIDHSDTSTATSSSNMEYFGGTILDPYFPLPMNEACPGLNVDASYVMQYNDSSAQEYSSAVHTSGKTLQTDTSTALYQNDWYWDTFLPKMKGYYKGELVWSKSTVSKQAYNTSRYWAIMNNRIYDLTDYLYTAELYDGDDTYSFLPSYATDLFQEYAGEDITDKWGSNTTWDNTLNCLNQVYYVGNTDFRMSPRCQINNYLLLAFTIILCAVILVKFLAALQLGSKKKPAPQDRFVICQIPAYTEGEDSLRKSLDSITALQYDNKRKLICVICDGMVVGGGNDRPTPKIVLDILGVDPKIDPPALPFKSVGEGSEQLNYGKVYSGLYEYEGNVVPYIVVVKVGKESEQVKSKPGNRGKRDSQILLMSFLNRVHHRSPMNPLELEMFHQVNNVIGVDPELYEYLLMIDADTQVKEDSLNRLVAACSHNAKIAGICGETSLENEDKSWWTMIQVYEYYISHHLAKAFESLFGSVTCLPGCFTMYRLRTADRGRPLIISDKVIADYSTGDVDTLHKKNLLSLGEDRYLTTLMTKYFPAMSFKFLPSAYAMTAAPDTWGILLSQRRRWINSTIHNLAELVMLKDLCGFCCFSMRFVVFIDLFGTVILPATCVYIGYLIYMVASGTGQFPLISIIMIASVYGLQMIIFTIKRQWQHIGWMIIYILAFPVYSFILPIYSFWNQDNFSWGNTRIVIGEQGSKQIVAVDDEGFDPRSVPLQRWDDYAISNGLPGCRGMPTVTSQEKMFQGGYTDEPGMMEMDDMHSVYSSAKPASTILTGFPQQGHAQGPYMPPHSPAPFQDKTPLMHHRNSTQTGFAHFTDAPNLSGHGTNSTRHMSVGNLSNYADNPMAASRQSMLGFGHQSSENLLRTNTRSPLANMSRPVSTVDFRNVPGTGPDENSIVQAVRACLAEVDLDAVTKKQVRALVEQRLQVALTGDKKIFLDRQIDTELANM